MSTALGATLKEPYSHAAARADRVTIAWIPPRAGGVYRRGLMSRSASTHGFGVSVGLAILSGVVLAACGSSTPPSSSGAATSAGSSTSSAAATSSGSSALPTTCPTAAAVSAAGGMTYPTPAMQTSAGFLTCTYADSTTGANLVMVISSVPGSTASTLQAVAQSQATAQKVTSSAVSGIGDAAYSMTLADAATNINHVATTIIEILKGSVLYDITAPATLNQLEAVVRLVLPQ